MRAPIAALALALAAAGCGGEDPPPPAAATPAPAAPALDVPAECRDGVPAGATPAPAYLRSPPGQVVVGKTVDDNGLTRVEGYVTLEPTAFVGAWRARGDVQLVDSESEGFEGEVWAQVGERQLFWKVKKVCDEGSTFVAVISEG